MSDGTSEALSIYDTLSGRAVLMILKILEVHLKRTGKSDGIPPIIDRLKKLEPNMMVRLPVFNFEEEMKKSSKCYIATMVYGEPDCAEVLALREFRDRFLARFWIGRVFIREYYKYSPAFVSRFRGCAWLHKLIRGCLDLFLKIIN